MYSVFFIIIPERNVVRLVMFQVPPDKGHVGKGLRLCVDVIKMAA